MAILGFTRNSVRRYSVTRCDAIWDQQVTLDSTSDDTFTYRQEQQHAWDMVVSHLRSVTDIVRAELRESCLEYLAFRDTADRFFKDRFSSICFRNCYENKLSACCTRDGIITFFGDLVVNALVSDPKELAQLLDRVANPRPEYAKCLYLGPSGCLWRLKPLVCEMFLCDAAMAEAFKDDGASEECWKSYKNQAHEFRFPDRPVLFDQLEMEFIAAGYQSSLMYINTSPALLRIKMRAGLPMVE